MRNVGHLALVGSTAVGKTTLAVALARRFGDLELVSVDAMAVYRGLDIGTAKPTPSERDGVRWHLLDLVDPEEEFSVARFQRAARDAVGEIERRGHRALLVGGTGLYHRAVIDELRLPGRYPAIAAELEREADRDLDQLYRRLAELDGIAASRIEPGNRRRIVRALEVTLGSGARFSSFGPGLSDYGPSAFTQIGLSLDRDRLDARIAARLADQLDAGFLDEVVRLAERPSGLARTARQALGYRELLEYLAGEQDFDTAIAMTLQRTRSFARRQERWFRRDPRVSWFEAERVDLVESVGAVATRDT